MSGFNRQAHGENVYTTKGETEISWFKESQTISLDLIRVHHVPQISVTVILLRQAHLTDARQPSRFHRMSFRARG